MWKNCYLPGSFQGRNIKGHGLERPKMKFINENEEKYVLGMYGMWREKLKGACVCDVRKGIKPKMGEW